MAQSRVKRGEKLFRFSKYLGREGLIQIARSMLAPICLKKSEDGDRRATYISPSRLAILEGWEGRASPFHSVFLRV
jgi:hypothetical protein